MMISTPRLVGLAAGVMLWLMLIVIDHTPGLVLAQEQGSATVERYGGEAQFGSEAPIPVHLEVRRSAQAIEGEISSYDTHFSLENARGGDIVTATLGGAGGGPITLHFSGDHVRGEFELGGKSGTVRATRTSKTADNFFRPPQQNLDLSQLQWREDLDRLVEILTTRHGSPYHRTSRTVFRREVERVRAALQRLSGQEIAVEFRRLAALVGDGHTTVAAAAGRPLIPLELYWFEDGLRVVEIPEEHRELLGARLTQVADVPIRDVLRQLRPYAAQGESAWSYRYVAPYLLADHHVMANAGFGRGLSRAFTFELMDGRSRQVTLAATTDRPRLTILGGRRPLWERDPAEAFIVTRLSEGSLYVNWRTYETLPEEGSALVSEMEEQRPRRLIIDLRDSGGGDFNVGREFIRQLAAKPWLNRPDRLFVLTGRRTFSAAMTNAVDFKKMSQATLLGEPPGAAPNNWQEVRSFHLPNSGLRVGVSTFYYEFLPGEQAVRPDVFIPPTPSDWGSEHDSAVRYILGLRCPHAD